MVGSYVGRKTGGHIGRHVGTITNSLACKEVDTTVLGQVCRYTGSLVERLEGRLTNRQECRNAVDRLTGWLVGWQEVLQVSR